MLSAPALGLAHFADLGVERAVLGDAVPVERVVRAADGADLVLASVELAALPGLQLPEVAAADILFNSDTNILLPSQTASGKTEAAFFPILTLFSEDMPKSIGCIYIGPLKALISQILAKRGKFYRYNAFVR